MGGRDHSPLSGIGRGVLLILIFVLAAGLFSWHFERRAKSLAERQTILDETGTLGDTARTAALDLARTLRERFGLELRLWVRQGPWDAPELGPRTAFIGISPDTARVEIALPPLLALGLGQDYVRILRESHFPPYFEHGRWQEGLATALESMQAKLRELETTHDGRG